MLFKSRKTKQKFNPDYWRDHSANERTYLSWMRASIALMGFGLVILRLRTASSMVLGLGWLLGFVFAMVGLLTVVIATRRYFLIRRAIDSNSYEPAQVWIIGVVRQKDESSRNAGNRNILKLEVMNKKPN